MFLYWNVSKWSDLCNTFGWAVFLQTEICHFVQCNSTFHLAPDATTSGETSDDTSERKDVSERDVNKSLFHYLNHEHLSQTHVCQRWWLYKYEEMIVKLCAYWLLCIWLMYFKLFTYLCFVLMMILGHWCSAPVSLIFVESVSEKLWIWMHFNVWFYILHLT